MFGDPAQIAPNMLNFGFVDDSPLLSDPLYKRMREESNRILADKMVTAQTFHGQYFQSPLLDGAASAIMDTPQIPQFSMDTDIGSKPFDIIVDL